MFRPNDPKTPYSDKEIALFAEIDKQHHTDDPQTSPDFILLIKGDFHTPPVMYRSAAEFAFALNWQGPHIEALRRAYKVMLMGEMKRMTPKWDALLTF
jgi:hypothetical protein